MKRAHARIAYALFLMLGAVLGGAAAWYMAGLSARLGAAERRLEQVERLTQIHDSLIIH